MARKHQTGAGLRTGDKMSEADVADLIAACCELGPGFQSTDSSDLGEVTVRIGGRTYRMTVEDITDRE